MSCPRRRAAIIKPGENRMTRTYRLVAMMTLAGAIGWSAATIFQSTGAAREPRFPQLTMDQLNDQQRPLGEKIMKISSVGIAGPYNPMLRSPELAQRMYDLLDYLRWHTSVPTRLNEFAILIQGRLWRSQVEWFAHAPLAIKAGLSPKIVADLKANRRPQEMAPDEETVYDFCMELSTKHEVSDATFVRLRQFLDDKQIVDLTAVSGTYVAVAMILAMAEEGVPPGKEPPFRPDEP
jgi:4-carboxymuconolactone decarboxylase